MLDIAFNNGGELSNGGEPFFLDLIQVSSGNRACPTATVNILIDGKHEVAEAAVGVHPIDAVFNAVERAVGISGQLVHMSVQYTTDDVNSTAKVAVGFCFLGEEDVFYSEVLNSNPLIACAHAHINALNKFYRARYLCSNYMKRLAP